MKSTIGIIAILMSVNLNAQLVIHKNGQEASGQYLTDTSLAALGPIGRFVDDFYIINTTIDTQVVVFERILHHNANGWHQIISDNLMDWHLSDETNWIRPNDIWVRLSVPPNDSTILMIRTYPNELAGCGIYEFNVMDENHLIYDHVVLTNTIDGINCIMNVEEVNELPFKIFPNPASNNLNIEILNLGNYTFRIFDLTGKEVLFHSLNQSLNQFDISSIGTGLYIYQVLGSNGVIKTERLIIE